MSSRVKGFVRPLAEDDPRNIHHPMHRENWLLLADALGKMDARAVYEAQMKGANDNVISGSRAAA